MGEHQCTRVKTYQTWQTYKRNIVWDEHLFQQLLNRVREIEHQGFDP